RRSEAAVELAVEAQVDVNALVARAIERAGGSGAVAAPRARLIGEQHELGVSIAGARIGELLLPGCLRVVEHEGNELHELGVGTLSAALPDVGSAGSPALVAAGQIADAPERQKCRDRDH